MIVVTSSGIGGRAETSTGNTGELDPNAASLGLGPIIRIEDIRPVPLPGFGAVALSDDNLAEFIKEHIPVVVLKEIEQIKALIDITRDNDPVLKHYSAEKPEAVRLFMAVSLVKNLFQYSDYKPYGKVVATLPGDASCLEQLEKIQKLSVAINGKPCISNEDLERFARDPEFTRKNEPKLAIDLVSNTPETIGRSLKQLDGTLREREAPCRVVSLPHLAVAHALFALVNQGADLFEGGVKRTSGGTLYAENGRLEVGEYNFETPMEKRLVGAAAWERQAAFQLITNEEMLRDNPFA